MSFWSAWWFHIPNYALAAILYTMVARFVLSLFVPPDWNNYIWRAFVRLTEPVVLAVRLLTPAYVLSPFLPLFAVVWLMMMRLLLLLVAGAVLAG